LIAHVLVVTGGACVVDRGFVADDAGELVALGDAGTVVVVALGDAGTVVVVALSVTEDEGFVGDEDELQAATARLMAVASMTARRRRFNWFSFKAEACLFERVLRLTGTTAGMSRALRSRHSCRIRESLR
jgi:hypothetical protein